MSSDEKKVKLLLCSCSFTGLIDENRRGEFISALENSGAEIHHYEDLCDSVLTGRDLPSKETLESIDYIVACFPRSVKNLLEYRGLSTDSQIINMRETEPSDLPDVFRLKKNRSEINSIKKTSDQPAWFPVIDYSRCTSCRQCSSFCLFDVYTVEENTVKVSKPGNCKNNCPACARICPTGAIIFPKSPETPVNGADITDEDALKEQIRKNRETILGDDIAGALRNRRKKASSNRLLKEKARETALKERDACSGNRGKNLFRMKKKQG